MTAFDEAVEALAVALRGVEGVRYQADPGKAVQPPATLLGPPTFAFEAYLPEPTTARLVVALVVKADAQAQRRLLALLPAVTAAIHNDTDAVVTSATPGSWQSGGSELPAYLVEIEVSLT